MVDATRLDIYIKIMGPYNKIKKTPPRINFKAKEKKIKGNDQSTDGETSSSFLHFALTLH